MSQPVLDELVLGNFQLNQQLLRVEVTGESSVP